MRNVFHQFQQQENRLTHALMYSLHEDHDLLKKFIQWAIGEQAPAGDLSVTEQSLPGEEIDEELEEPQRWGLPDGWIFNDDHWALLIESKIECPLEADQIRRHRLTANRRGFAKVHTLALVKNTPSRLIDPELKIRYWTELYVWLKPQAQKSDWAKRLRDYMEVLEETMVKDEYLKSGTLTVFDGIPFNTKHPYNYFEAKRVLRLAMDELRKREDLDHTLGIEKISGRGAITGKDAGLVWDYLRLKKSSGSKNSTEFPHLTLGLHREFMVAFLIIPNGLRSDFRRNLLGQGLEPLRVVLSNMLSNFNESLGDVRGVVPWIELVQRRYPSQRSEPFIDAKLEFDLRTACSEVNSTKGSPKLQPQWLGSIYEALTNRNANLQVGAGARFSYDQCHEVGSQKVLNHIANAWIACEPLIGRILGS